jgi:hypothetical protein
LDYPSSYLFKVQEAVFDSSQFVLFIADALVVGGGGGGGARRHTRVAGASAAAKISAIMGMS